MTLHPGDRVQLTYGDASGKIGTVIRIGGNNGNVVIAALDEEGDSVPHNIHDLAGAASIGLDISKRSTTYAGYDRIKPVIDSKTPPGTKVHITYLGEELDAVFVRNNDNGLNPYPICRIPQKTHALGVSGLSATKNREAARELGFDPDIDIFTTLAPYSSMTFISSPEPKPAPKQTSIVPGTTVSYLGHTVVFVCQSEDKSFAIVVAPSNVSSCDDCTSGRLRRQSHRDAALALGLDPNAEAYWQVASSKLLAIDQEPVKAEMPILPSGLMLAGAALGGLISALCKTTTIPVRVATEPTTASEDEEVEQTHARSV